MNSRERFVAAYEHREADRAPVDYLAHPATDRRVREYYGVNSETELLDALQSDFYYLSCRDISQNESCLPFYQGPELELTETERVCPLGIRFHRGAGASKFFVDDAVAGPLEQAMSEKDVLSHTWPTPDWFDFDPFMAECEANSHRVIVGGFWTGILGDCYRMHGFQNFLLNIALQPEMIHTLIKCMADFYLAMNDRLFAQLKGKLDVWFFGNDFGSQESLLFSVDMFAEFFLPHIERSAALAHSYGLKVMMHSCGAIAEIIPLLIEAGVDVIDPVQTTAKGMAAETLKEQFGERIVFHGAIDTQRILPYGSPAEVKVHAREMLNVLGANGGYIFAPSQILGPDIPAENIAAMYGAVAE